MDHRTALIAAVWAWRQNTLRAIALLPTVLAAALPLPSSEDTDELLTAALRDHHEAIPRSPILAVEHLTDQDAHNRFRFSIDELKVLVVALELPMYLVVNRVTLSSLFCLALLLRRLVWSSRLCDLSIEFGYDDTTISLHFNHLLLLLTTKYSRLLHLWPGVTQQRIVDYERAIRLHSPAIRSIWCFLDGTLRRIAKPVRGQRIHYTGYKRTHGLTYQTLVAPDGLIVSVSRPYPASRNDVAIWHACGLREQLVPLVTQGQTVYHIFGDKAYQGEALVMAPFKAAVTDGQRLYNTAMSQLRVSVEHGYARLTNLWSFTDVKRQQRSLLQPCGAYYHAMVLFANLRTCMDGGNQISDTFVMTPPTMVEYLNGQM